MPASPRRPPSSRTQQESSFAKAIDSQVPSATAQKLRGCWEKMETPPQAKAFVCDPSTPCYQRTLRIGGFFDGQKLIKL